MVELKSCKKNNQLYYFKLHGSIDWIDEDKHIIITGSSSAKKEKMKGTEVLNHYYQFFQEQIQLPNTKIIIFGYSFNDSHINEKLADANEAEIYIIDKYCEDIIKRARKNKIKNIRALQTHII